jgi:hypothetical protein
MEEAKKKGFIPYAGPYKPITEKFMIENAVYDILSNGRDKYGIVKLGNMVEIWIIPSYYRSGFVFNHGEPDTTTPDAGEATEEAAISVDAPIMVTPVEPQAS